MSKMDASQTAIDLSENLRRIIEGNKSIAEVCEAANINRQQFNKYLNGTSTPSVHIAHRIAQALNVSLDALVERNDATDLRRASFEHTMDQVAIRPPTWVKEGLYMEYTLSELEKDSVTIAMASISAVGGIMRYKRKFVIPRWKGAPKAYWTYHGFCAETRGGLQIVYANSTARESMGATFVCESSWDTSVLVGIKLATSPRDDRMPYAVGTMLSRLPEMQNHLTAFRRCGTASIQDLDTTTRHNLLEFRRKLIADDALFRSPVEE